MKTWKEFESYCDVVFSVNDVIAEVIPKNYTVHQLHGINSYGKAAIEVIRDLL